MRRDYKYSVIELPNLPPLMEISDPPYFPEDIFELIGSKGFVVTFTFINNTESESKYGNTITGPIFYPKGMKEQITKCIVESIPFNDDSIRVRIVLPQLKQPIIDELKYKGFPLGHVQSMTFVPYHRDPEIVSGVKIVPNIIRIPVSAADFQVDEDVFLQNMLFRKLYQKTELIPEEKAKLVGSILAMDKNQIDPELLTSLGYTQETAGSDRRIWYHYYLTKKRRNLLSEDEVQKLKNVESEDLLHKFALLTSEIAAGHEPGEAISLAPEQVSTIVESLKKFYPRVLIPIRRQIWWDTKSYLHIVLRHVKDLQIGKINRGKTPFPYGFMELELLIEKVIDSVIGEVKEHFESKEMTCPFYRSGKMSVPYNGDYYSFHIRGDGLLENIHIVE